MDVKKRLLDIMEYLTRQVEEDDCTPEEMESIFEAIVNNLRMKATVKDIAKFYGQKEANVRNVISRNYIPEKDKPVRRVMYPLGRIMSFIPSSWKHTN